MKSENEKKIAQKRLLWNTYAYLEAYGYKAYSCKFFGKQNILLPLGRVLKHYY